MYYNDLRKTNMSYTETQCIHLSELKEKIKNEYFGEFVDISDVKLYKNAKKQHRLKFTLHNKTRSNSKQFNLLASLGGKQGEIYVNKKSMEYALTGGEDEEAISKTAEALLM